MSAEVPSPFRVSDRWLHRYAILVASCTLALIALGGLVTSREAGMAVPDWPTTYGYNMFFFPFRLWQGGIFDEHVHRLAASGVGLLTVILAVWVQWVEPRSWVKKLGWSALALVVFQGVLGGKRVMLNSVPVFGVPGSIFFGVFHAATAQVFLCLLGTLALATSRFWQTSAPGSVTVAARWVPLLTGLILLQLLVAATMRHQHAGLAIPDFPLAHGRWYPPTDADFVSALNQRRSEVLAYSPITAFQIHLQMVHRLLAIVILAGVWAQALGSIKTGGLMARWAWLWSSLLLVQFTLGIVTVLTDKAADMATAHVVVGAASLLTGVLFSLVVWRLKWDRVEDSSCPRPLEFLNPLPVPSESSGATWRPAR